MFHIHNVSIIKMTIFDGYIPKLKKLIKVHMKPLEKNIILYSIIQNIFHTQYD